MTVWGAYVTQKLSWAEINAFFFSFSSPVSANTFIILQPSIVKLVSKHFSTFIISQYILSIMANILTISEVKGRFLGDSVGMKKKKKKLLNVSICDKISDNTGQTRSMCYTHDIYVHAHHRKFLQNNFEKNLNICILDTEVRKHWDKNTNSVAWNRCWPLI